MQKFRKAGLLILLLAVPAFIFIFLKLFGINHYDLPTFHPAKNPTTGEVTLSNGDTVYYAVQGLKLLSSRDSAMFTEANLRDKFTVAHVLPTVCSDTCQKALTQLSRVHDLTQSIPQLQFLTITEGGTTGLDSLSNQYGMNSASWVVVTGSQEEVNRAAGEVIRLSQNIPASTQTISLSNRLILIDGVGHIRGYYDAQDIEDVDRLMAEIKVLEYSNSLKK
ncbi:SCO family protein [Telluribacter sp. SYSU D00476]|uniref:SCO family protein n=1 Tax=Telluribacter sp. SYSU D00476 TaxID=2811430 RepID=UPI001FF1E680|nr:SCO family protein [Telluribacter sp. SYSU D00476]